MDAELHQQLAEIMLTVLEDCNKLLGERFLHMYQGILLCKCKEGEEQVLRTLRTMAEQLLCPREQRMR